MTTPAVVSSTSPRSGDARLQRLREGVQGLRTRRSEGSRDRLLLIGGGIAVPLGLLMILLGWYGAAHTVLPFEQTPFLISGGLLGLGLVFAGGFVYFSYWLTLAVREARLERERAEARDARVEALLQLAVDRLAGLGAAPRAPRQPQLTGGGELVMTAAGSMLHRASCPITDRQAVHLAAWDDSLAVCDLCAPERPEDLEIVLPAARSASRTRAPRTPAVAAASAAPPGSASPVRRARSPRVGS